MKAKVRADPEKIVDVELRKEREMFNARLFCRFCNEPIGNLPVKIVDTMAICDFCFDKYYEIIDID